MPDASPSNAPRRGARAVADTWRALGPEQRVAGVGTVLLIVSTFGPFSFVEGAIVLIGLSVLLLLRRRAQGREFHLPFGDGTMIAAAGVWSAALILLRLFSRPLGQGLLALVCATIIVLAGLRERARRPPDDLPEDATRRQRGASGETRSRRRVRRRRSEAAAPQELFGVDPPEWTTPPSGDPSAAEPPTWSRPDPSVEPVDPPAPSDGRDTTRRVPPASPVARGGERRELDGGSDGGD